MYKMNDRQLNYILTIAREGNITTAAQKLFISQPSLSCMLANVEKELGIKLFDRSISHMSLTYAGECYVNTAKQILSAKRELEQQIYEIQAYQKGRLSIGCGRQLSSILFPLVIPVFRNQYPGFSIKLIEENLAVLHDMLCSGDLDIAFSYEKIDNSNLKSLLLYEEQMMVFAPATFPFSSADLTNGTPTVDLTEIKDKPFVLFKAGNHLRGVTDQIFSDFNITPKIILETDNWQTCMGMVKMEEAFTLLPFSPVVKNSVGENISYYSIGRNYTRSIYIYYQKSLLPLKIIQDFIASVQDMVKQ